MNIKTNQSIRTIFLSCCLIMLASAYCKEQIENQSKPAIFVDLDGVITKSLGPSSKTRINLLLCVFNNASSEPYSIQKHFQEKNTEMAKLATYHEDIEETIQYLKVHNYGDFTDCKTIIMDILVRPEPIMEVIEQLIQLKQQGHILIGATNQDYTQNIIYQEKLKQQGIDLDELFDAILTVYSPNAKTEDIPTYPNKANINKKT